jgi:ABC-type microcin C transport system permease subunit YejE
LEDSEITYRKEVFEELKKNTREARSIPIAVLLILAVVLSAASGIYAGASFFPQLADVTITTTIYTTTTSWTTSTIWSTLTSVVYGVWTTVTYTTRTSTITQTQTPPPPPTTSSIYATVNLRVPRITTVTVTVSQGPNVVATQSHTMYTTSYTFVFGGLAAGTYTVSETAPGTVGQSQTVTVPPNAQVTFSGI